MTEHLLQLYPQPTVEVPLCGLYLAHNLHQLGSRQRPLVYANFLTSLDGRIALIDKEKDASYLPKALTSRNDLRLLQELQAQADCFVTHGGYLRAIADGRLNNILQIGNSEQTKDLAAWREEQGMKGQPAIVVVSNSLQFGIPPSVKDHSQTVYIATTESADQSRIDEWEQQGYEVIIAGKEKMVEGGPLVSALGERGYRSLFLLAGPLMLETMLRHHQLSRLYITLTHQVLGGSAFHTIVRGSELEQAGKMKMKSLYYDASSPQGAGQWFSLFESKSGPLTESVGNDESVDQR